MSVILITGAIAAGKSTVGERVATHLRDEGRSTVFIDLDDVVLGIHGSLEWESGSERQTDWLEARRAAARQVNDALAEGSCVVIAGPFYLQDEIDGLIDHLTSGHPVFLYVLHVPLETRLERNEKRERASLADELRDQEQAIRNLPATFGAAVRTCADPDTTAREVLVRMRSGVGRLVPSSGADV